MKKIFSLLTILSLGLMSFATDWSSIAFLGDGAGGGLYSNKYKVEAAFGQNVVNIQLDGDKPAIYSYFLAAVTSCSLPADQYRINGAGIYLYLSAFTAKETAVSVEAGGVSYDFKVFYADGTGEISQDEPGDEPGDEPQPGDLTPATFYGSEVKQVAGSDVTFNWSITRNADATLTFEISWSSEIQGVVPQVSINDVYTTLPMQGMLARFTTKETYTDGSKPVIFFLIAYTGNAARIDVDYTVGASNTKPGGTAIDNVNAPVKARKVIENGQIVILKNGMRYNALGTEIK
ncbi:MAG: hypothetical protein IJ249_08360 [Paludibacteraceae bacterium]|nr:hypothetical protein [Paludibacteraceae bacterium]